MYVVVVDFRIKPERLAEFMPLMLENARASRETEPGCRVFDVCVDPKDRTSVFLYEVYDDRAAFDAAVTHIHQLDPSFTPRDDERQPFMRLAARLLGTRNAVLLHTAVKRAIKRGA